MGTDRWHLCLNLDGQFHHMQNAYAAGPAVFRPSAQQPLFDSVHARPTNGPRHCAEGSSSDRRRYAVSPDPTLDGWQLAGSGKFNGWVQQYRESEGGIACCGTRKRSLPIFYSIRAVALRSTPSTTRVFFRRFPILGSQIPHRTGSWRLTKVRGSDRMTGI